MVIKKIGNYVIQQKIGEGGFAKVYLAKHIKLGDLVAIKRINKDKEKSEKLIREINIMRELDHPFAVKFYELLEDENRYYIVMEYIEGLTLLDVANSGMISEWRLRHMFVQITCCLAYLHSVLNVAHRDIKLENIILDKNGNVRIIDFGLSNSYEGTGGILNTACGSPQYAAPEMFLGEPYTDAADMWSLGCVLYALATGQLPFDETNQRALANMIVYQHPIYPNDLSPELKELIAALLSKSPAHRPTTTDVFHFEWVTKYPFHEVFDTQYFFNEGYSVRGPINENIVEEMKNNGLDVAKIINEISRGSYSSDSAYYRIVHRRMVIEKMATFVDKASTQLPKITSRSNPPKPQTYIATVQRPSVVKKRYMFNGAMLFKNTVRISNKLQQNTARSPVPVMYH